SYKVVIGRSHNVFMTQKVASSHHGSDMSVTDDRHTERRRMQNGRSPVALSEVPTYVRDMARIQQLGWSMVVLSIFRLRPHLRKRPRTSTAGGRARDRATQAKGYTSLVGGLNRAPLFRRSSA